MTSDRYLFTVIITCFQLLTMLIFTNNCHLCDGYFFGPEFQICDATRLRNFRKNFCSSKLVFTSNSTKINSDCICVSGIWVIINRDCITSTLVSKDGCILSPQIKAMQYLGTFGKDDFFTVITESEVDFTFRLLRPIQNAVVNGQIWLYNGILSKSANGSFCAERWQLWKFNETKKLDEITRYAIDGKLTVQYECPRYYKELIIPNLQYDLRNRETSECEIDCSKQTASKLVIKREMKTGASSHPHAHHFFKRKKFSKKKRDMDKLLMQVKDDNNKTTVATASDRKAISPGLKSLIHHLHRRLLIKMLAYGFHKRKYGMDSRPEFIPQGSFRVLEKLKDIVFKTCAGKVSKMFLEFAYVMFRVLYENRGTNLMEYLKEKDEKDIIQFLNECHESISPLKFNKADVFCPDEIIKTVERDDVYVTVNATRNYSSNFYLEERHLAMEIPWNMIDLTLAMCINAFAESYILYHKMEQALEKLFIKDLKILWAYPPDNGMLYTRIYGPNWKYYAENLERCVQSVYIHNPKLTRLKRPGEMGMHLTPKSKFGIGYMLLGSHSPIQIPQITEMGSPNNSNIDYPVSHKIQEKSILKSVDLTCQPMNVSQCYFEY